jgi:glc operon protein GlcG
MAMRTHVLITLFVASLIGGAALAQQPAPSPPPATPAAPPPAPPPDYGATITNEQARAVAGAAVAEARKNNWRMAFAIVGSAGELVYFEKMDGAQLAAVEGALGKARTSVMYRRSTKTFADQHAAGNTAFTTFPDRPVASEGGLPIVVSGRIVGAIGASGGTGQQNGLAAGAGAAAAR